VPSTERSRAVTTVWGGLDVGSAVGLLLSGPLIRMYGWPSVFYLFAVLGGIWCLLWPLVRPSMQVGDAPIMAGRGYKQGSGRGSGRGSGCSDSGYLHNSCAASRALNITEAAWPVVLASYRQSGLSRLGMVFPSAALKKSALSSGRARVVFTCMLELDTFVHERHPLLVLQDPLMSAQSAAAATSGVVRVPHIPVGADASSSAAASEAITDTRSVAGETS